MHLLTTAPLQHLLSKIITLTKYQNVGHFNINTDTNLISENITNKYWYKSNIRKHYKQILVQI